MKLSDMPLAQARDTMVELTGAISELVSDQTIAAFFSEQERKQSTPDMMMQIVRMVQAVLRDHYDAALSVLSVLTGEAKETLNQKTVAEIVILAKGVYDQDLHRFFTS